MRSDAGINGDAQCIEQITWMFFLKGYDTQEETWEYKAYKEKKEYNSIIPESLRRRVSAQQKFPGGYSDSYVSLISLFSYPEQDWRFRCHFCPSQRQCTATAPAVHCIPPRSVRASVPASTCDRPCKYLQPYLQVLAGKGLH